VCAPDGGETVSTVSIGTHEKPLKQLRHRSSPVTRLKPGAKDSRSSEQRGFLPHAWNSSL